MANVELRVNGKIYRGWQAVRINRGIEKMSGAFTLSVSERWPGQATPRPMHVGDACEVKLENTTVITGFVDQIEMAYDAKSHDVAVRGRDATGQLVDCSAPYSPNTMFYQKTLEYVAKYLCKPYGVQVKVETDTGGMLPQFTINPGETVFEALSRAASALGLLLTCDGLGNLVITRAGKTKIRTALVSGENILTARRSIDIKDWYHRYFFTAHAGDDNFSPAVTVIDNTNPFTSRNITVVADDYYDLAAMQKRAEWERRRRAAAASKLTVTVQGWTHADGLWQPNTRVHVTDTLLNLDHDLLIADVTWMLDDRGTRTELKLALPETYDLIELWNNVFDQRWYALDGGKGAPK